MPSANKQITEQLELHFAEPEKRSRMQRLDERLTAFGVAGCSGKADVMDVMLILKEIQAVLKELKEQSPCKDATAGPS